jgi:hypothetical protein
MSLPEFIELFMSEPHNARTARYSTPGDSLRSATPRYKTGTL